MEAWDDGPIHDGVDAPEDGADATRVGGREGKAAEGAARTDGLAVHPGGPEDATGAGPPSLVLFFNFRTLVECFCAAAVGAAGFALAALAQPLSLVVAPSMPLSPGKLG